MKKDIHPTYQHDTVVTCACGNTFMTGSILPKIRVEICSNCHPFYTGQQKYIDTEGKVDKFERERSAAKEVQVSKRKLKKTQGRVAVKSERDTSTKTLKQMLEDVRKR